MRRLGKGDQRSFELEGELLDEIVLIVRIKVWLSRYSQYVVVEGFEMDEDEKEEFPIQSLSFDSE